MTRIAASAEMVEVAAELIRATPMAWLINDGTRDLWLPKRLCEWDGAPPAEGKAGTLYVTRWLAKKEGLI